MGASGNRAPWRPALFLDSSSDLELTDPAGLLHVFVKVGLQLGEFPFVARQQGLLLGLQRLIEIPVAVEHRLLGGQPLPGDARAVIA